MPDKKDYYELLGVARDAGADDIKKAYRQKARKYHPDVNRDDPKAEDKFKEITDAYEVLTDPQKRSAYDRFGHDAFDPTKQAGGFGGGFDFENMGGGFGDLFDIIFGSSGFGGRQRRTGPQRGADKEMRLEIKFEDAIFGNEKEVEVTRIESCEHCKGTGAQPGSETKSCPTCNGSGQTKSVQSTPFGRFETVKTCARCNGEGKIIEKPCTHCKGQGKMRKARKINVRIPAGVDSGSRLRIPSEGEQGINGGPPGDLYIGLNVRPHAKFQREGYTLITKLEINFVQAALGDSIEITLLGGEKYSVQIPEGTQPGEVLSIKGKGIPHLQSSRVGDLKVVIQVSIPKKISARQKELLHSFYDDSSGKNAKKGIIDKFKDAMG